eukprot:gene894-biopygen8591
MHARARRPPSGYARVAHRITRGPEGHHRAVPVSRVPRHQSECGPKATIGPGPCRTLNVGQRPPRAGSCHVGERAAQAPLLDSRGRCLLGWSQPESQPQQQSAALHRRALGAPPSSEGRPLATAWSSLGRGDPDRAPPGLPKQHDHMLLSRPGSRSPKSSALLEMTKKSTAERSPAENKALAGSERRIWIPGCAGQLGTRGAEGIVPTGITRLARRMVFHTCAPLRDNL